MTPRPLPILAAVALAACGTAGTGNEAAANATQALGNPYYGIDGVKLLREGREPREVVEALIATDDGREARQLHVMDIKGRIAAHTGAECVDWCGHIQGDGFSLAGNMLAGAAVLDDTAQAFIANATPPFAQRLIVAMKAGEAAGGDKRGKQSAALVIQGEEDWSDLDLRVDDHTDPLAELERLEQLMAEEDTSLHFLPAAIGRADTSVVEENIKAAKGFAHACEQRLDRRGIADVRRNGQRGAPGNCRLGDRLFQRLAAAPGEGDAIAFLLQILLKQLRERFFVFYDKNLGRRWHDLAASHSSGPASARGRCVSISSPVTRKWMYSAMLVEWSPMRSMFLAMNRRCAQDEIVRASSIM